MIKAILLDLDGTVYWGDKDVDGASEFVEFLRKQNIECLFVTNRSNRTPTTIREQLESHNIPCTEDEIVTSSQATTLYLKKGSVFFIGEEGMRLAIEESELTLNDESPDYVIVSYDRKITKEKISKAANLISNGAKFIASNPDKGLVTETTVLPGTGSIVEAVAAECGVEPIYIGKPERRIIDMALEKLTIPKEEIIVVGDNVETDVLAGQKADLRTVLILTGISTREYAKEVGIEPTWITEDFKELTELILKENGLS